ncbi:DNA-binding protein [Croceicoccus ponticola]|uniref:DNA-binding protein n=1 Tax=Croceicoccus ponticola TaxID=2217664 RepID=A0A437GVC4_9SPHN|nr:DNA-binding protein [Croceicoccus ponticola]RVQ65736.1 DNA-binding protein [Croceicoccus ponticola]
MVEVTPDGRVSRAEAARFLGFKAKTLAEWHRLGIGPRSLMVGGRRFYMLEELLEYASGKKSIRREAA